MFGTKLGLQKIELGFLHQTGGFEVRLFTGV